MVCPETDKICSDPDCRINGCLEQREEDLRARDRRVREREARFDAEAAAALKAEAEAARHRDDFKE